MGWVWLEVSAGIWAQRSDVRRQTIREMWHSWLVNLHKLYVLAFPHSSWCNYHMTGWDVNMDIIIFPKLEQLEIWKYVQHNVMFHPWSQNLWLIIDVCQRDHRQIPLRCHPNPRDQSENSPVTLTSCPRFQWKQDHTLSMSELGVFSSLSYTFYILTVKVGGIQETTALMPDLVHIKGTPGTCAIWPAWPGIICYPAGACNDAVFIAKMRVIKIYVCLSLHLFH